MTELERILPQHDVGARYETRVAAPVATTWQALMHTNFSDSRAFRWLIRLRGYGAGIKPRAVRESLSDRLRRGGFIELSSVPEQEIVWGVIGKFWRPDGSLVRNITPEAFAGFEETGYAKAVWNFSLTPAGASEVLLTTETRVRCYGARARRKFKGYWFFIGPFSGLIRREMLRLVREQAETIASEKATAAR